MFQKKGVGTRRLKYRISRGFAARDGSAVKSHSTIRSLRNEDDDGYEDFILKYKFVLFISQQSYFMSFRVKNV